MLQSIVDTCRVCRQRTRSGPRNITSASLHTMFVDAVQVGPILHWDWVVLVIVDSTTRWTSAELVPWRDAETRAETNVIRWITPYGPPQTFVVDGETGLNIDAAAQALVLHNTSTTLRAPGQHAKKSEKLIHILRQHLELVGTQPIDEGYVLIPYRVPPRGPETLCYNVP